MEPASGSLKRSGHRMNGTAKSALNSRRASRREMRPVMRRKVYRRGPCSLGVQPIDDYWQAVPGAHCALNVPVTVTEPAPPTEASVAEKVKVPATLVGDEAVITNWPDVEVKNCIVPPLV